MRTRSQKAALVSDNDEEIVNLDMKPLRKRFTPEEDRILKKYLNNGKKITWEAIAQLLPGRTARQCWDRYNNYLYKRLSNDKWKPEEDSLILKMYHSIGPKWTKIASMLNGRSGNNVKNRWHKFLSKKNNQFKLAREFSKMKEKVVEPKIEEHIEEDHIFDIFDFSRNSPELTYAEFFENEIDIDLCACPDVNDI